MLSFYLQELLILITTPVYICLVLVEFLLSHLRQRKWYNWKDTFQNVYLMLLNTGLDLLVRGAWIFLLSACWHYRFIELENPWIYWPVIILGMDFLFYWLHRLEHSVRLFWVVHVTHHSSKEFNLTVGFRSSVLQPIYRYVFFIPLAFIGFKAVDIIVVFSACQIWGILVHTKMVDKLGWLEKILVTPSHHRVHHACNARYLDKNMGMLLITWDKLFGTFQPELAENEYQPIRYGLTESKNLGFPFSVVLHEGNDMLRDLKRKIPLKLKFGYLFGPPGWSHDGSRYTSEQLRQKEQDFEN